MVRRVMRKEGADLDVRLLGPVGQELARSTTLVFPPGPATFAHLAPAAARGVVALRGPRWADPYRWAGFVLQGDWR